MLTFAGEGGGPESLPFFFFFWFFFFAAFFRASLSLCPPTNQFKSKFNLNQNSDLDV